MSGWNKVQLQVLEKKQAEWNYIIMESYEVDWRFGSEVELKTLIRNMVA